jgi:hypothetical protein
MVTSPLQSLNGIISGTVGLLWREMFDQPTGAGEQPFGPWRVPNRACRLP